jgi:hypothetical protein
MKCGEKRRQKLAGKYGHRIFAARLKNRGELLTKLVEIHARSWKKI